MKPFCFLKTGRRLVISSQRYLFTVAPSFPKPRTGTMQWEAPASRPHFSRWWSEPSQGIAGEVSCSHAPTITRDNEEKCLRKGNSVRDVLSLLSPIDVRPIPCSQNQSTPFVRCTWTRQTSSCIDTGQDAGPRPPAKVDLQHPTGWRWPLPFRLRAPHAGRDTSDCRSRIRPRTGASQLADGKPRRMHRRALSSRLASSAERSCCVSRPRPSWTPYVTQSAVIGIKRAEQPTMAPVPAPSFPPSALVLCPQPKALHKNAMSRWN